MNGKTLLVVGLGGEGKTTLCLDILDGQAPQIIEEFDRMVPGRQKWLVIAPTMSHDRLYTFDRISDTETPEEPLRQKIQRALKESNGHLLLLVKTDNPNLFDALMEEYPPGSKDEKGNDISGRGYFEGQAIFMDEISNTVSTPELKKSWKGFIRQIRQKNMILVMSTHRLKDDLPPVTLSNTGFVYLCGIMTDGDEVDIFYKKGNIIISKEEFAEKLKTLPPYAVWNGKGLDRNPEAIYVIKDKSARRGGTSSPDVEEIEEEDEKPNA